MLTLEQIRDKLADRNLEIVAERTGIHRNTLSAIRTGQNQNPTYNTIMILNNYLIGAAE